MKAPRGLPSGALAAIVGAGAAALFFLSRGRWSDSLIDSGREWIVPDALARGELLYRDVVYWFGPVTPYLHALFFRVFGSGLGTLVFAGALAGVAVLFVLRAALSRVTGRREAALWTALAVPTLLFMPNAGGVLLGMGYRIWHAAAFTLGAVALASAPRGKRPRLYAGLAGACAGLAGLCRVEWGLAGLAAVVLASLVRPQRRIDGMRAAAWAAGAAAVVFAAGLAPFFALAGGRTVVSDNHVLLTGLPLETRRFLLAFSGLPDWKSGAVELLYSAAMWLGLFSLVRVLSRPAGDGRRRALAALVVILALLAAAAAAGGAGGAVLFSAAPLLCVAGAAAGIGRRHGSAAAALASSGLAGLLLSYRRPFHIGDSAYVGPPLLFAFVCAAGLLHLSVLRERGRLPANPLAARLRWIVAALVVFAFLGRAWQYASVEAVPIRGTAGMLSARPEVAREVEGLAASIRRDTPEGSGLVVFPEGELLNLLSQRTNPIRHKLYLPGYLTDENEQEVLRELRESPPAAVVLWRRPVAEYGRSLFGEDYGRAIRAWLEESYRLEPFRAAGAPARANPRFVYGIRKDLL